MGNYLRPLGKRVALVGKTHMRADLEGMARLGIDPESEMAQLILQGGFEPYERDDGLHPDPIVAPGLSYNEYLKAAGYDSDNPWQNHANSALDPDGKLLSGWYMRHASQPANIKAEDSETPYMTRRAKHFIEAAGDESWCLHLSYIKPHWPYIVPAPYHDMYGPKHILPAQRHKAERQNPHPVYAAFMKNRESQAFQRDEVRQTVIPAYMGLIKQIDDSIGDLMHFLEEAKKVEETLIVFTSDHGDYLGDHWLGEKDLFHEPSVRIPLIIRDPSASADVTRGHVEDRLVESIDLLPTFLEIAGGAPQPHRLEGRSLLPLLQGESVFDWREIAVSEVDYSGRETRVTLNLPPAECRATMIRNMDWKYILHEQFAPQLFDLQNDPHEYYDLGTDSAYKAIRRDLHEQLFRWFRQRKTRVTISEEEIPIETENPEKHGYLIGYW